MQKLITLLFWLLIPILVVAQVNSNHVRVNGYYRSNGTYVRGHNRTAPNYTNRDNFSALGNVNPYTGKPGWVPPDNKPLPGYYNSNLDYNYISNAIPATTIATSQWKASEAGYYFYYKGRQVSTTSQRSGNDLIVYYDNYAYLLKDYAIHWDNTARDAIPIATWKSDGNRYSFFFDGRNLSTQTTNQWLENDLVVYFEDYAYILEDYSIYNDNKIRAARGLPTWKSSGGSYYFYINGQSVADRTQNTWFGNDLIITYDGIEYLLPNFSNAKSNTLNFGIELPKWKSSNNSYYFYIGGGSFADKTTNEWLEDHLIVFYEENGYILLDYKTRKDGNLRTAYPVPTWKRAGNNYYFFINGESVANQTTCNWSGNDLIVTYCKQSYILENFKNLNDGKIHLAKYLTER